MWDSNQVVWMRARGLERQMGGTGEADHCDFVSTQKQPLRAQPSARLSYDPPWSCSASDFRWKDPSFLQSLPAPTPLTLSLKLAPNPLPPRPELDLQALAKPWKKLHENDITTRELLKCYFYN